MFKSIVWATDGSEAADRALPTVMELGTVPGAVVTAFHDDEHFEGRASAYPVLTDEPELRAKIRGQVELLKEAGVDAKLEISTHVGNDPADAIATIARGLGADVIVVGTRGHGRMAGTLLGSVTQRLLHVAPCPVLAVPPMAQAGEAGREAATATAR
jgi:nucleotide-binding universal stress UspA family protein